MPQIIKILGSTKPKRTNDGNVQNLEMIEVVLAHCSIVKNDYQHNSRVILAYISVY